MSFLDAALRVHERTADFVWRRSGAARDAPWTEPEGFLVILMLAAGCDHGMGRLEDELLQHLTHRWYATGVVEEKDGQALKDACVTRLSKGEAVLPEACAALTAGARESVFAQALDIMLCDRALHPAEKSFAERLARELGLSDIDAARIAAIIARKNAY